ncbi:MAG: ribonuclease III [Patescibacteria group bacterium]|jgi:ribonuclease-3
MAKIELANLQKQLGVNFNNQALLKQAITHRSYLNEHPEFKLGHNERLEFLGDAVLEIIVTEYLYLNYQTTPEGELTNWRAALVNAKMLYEIAQELNIDEYLLLSKGEAKDKNKKARQFILADVMEAIIGAIYLDQGMEVAKVFVLTNIVSKLDEVLENQAYLDPKSHFQEKAQEQRGITPHYEIISETGLDHDKTFVVGLYLNDELITTGEGSSKQEAQVMAATLGLKKLNW